MRIEARRQSHSTSEAERQMVDERGLTALPVALRTLLLEASPAHALYGKAKFG